MEHLEPTRNFFGTFFMVLGFILVLLVLAAVYFIVADPFGFKSMMFNAAQVPSEKPTGGTIEGTVTAPEPTGASDAFMLSEAQKEALRGYGIDPATVPTTITPLQVLCFEEKLGTSRVAEIRGGAVPTAFELFRVKSCIGQ